MYCKLLPPPTQLVLAGPTEGIAVAPHLMEAKVPTVLPLAFAVTVAAPAVHPTAKLVGFAEEVNRLLRCWRIILVTMPKKLTLIRQGT